ARRMQGSFWSFVMPFGTSHPWVWARTGARPMVMAHRNEKTSLRYMTDSFTHPAVGSIRLRRTEIGYGSESHWIVNRRKVGRLFLPLTAGAGQLFALLLECLHPLPNDRSFVDARLKAAVMVVIFGHLRRTRGSEKFFDLVIGKLAHQARIETAPFFADERIAQAIVCRQALGERGLALFRCAVCPRFL